jgi:hypothetical protein
MRLGTVIFLTILLPSLQLNIGKKYLKTATIVDESLILAIVLRNYSTKPSNIFGNIYLTYSTSKQESEVSTFVFVWFDFP